MAVYYFIADSDGTTKNSDIAYSVAKACAPTNLSYYQNNGFAVVALEGDAPEIFSSIIMQDESNIRSLVDSRFPNFNGNYFVNNFLNPGVK